ncbi:MAG: M18 family aminopeptidase [Gammaproteobacteria bacterium]|nr:M18 family aminopeptidase [Gammaproteobacteria bacterium]
MTAVQFNQQLLRFLQQSPTAFHAVANMKVQLEEAGFQILDEASAWQLQADKGYLVTRNDSALIAFCTGRSNLQEGLRISGAHTDSPCLKLKPDPVIEKNGYVQLGVEVYGGALYAPWFDRDLSLAGRVNFQNRSGELKSTLIDIEKPIAVIPSLAIHLFRDVHNGRSLNPQKELLPVLQLAQDKEHFDFERFLLALIRKQTGNGNATEILAHELFFYDTQPPALIGMKEDFIASARLDNLLSCFVACQGLIRSKGKHASLLVCNDHEEVGSASTSGAQGPFLKSVLARLAANLSTETDALERVSSLSTFLSLDNAHGVHPNYVEKHDDMHRPVLNGGPVIKLNANQRYASNSESVALFKSICNKVKVPFQAFAMRNDMACGSTIGPITATGTGITTVDVGVATFAMHSIRELAGSKDAFALLKVVKSYFDR